MLVFLMYNISEEHLEVPRRCIDLNLSWCFFAKVGIKYQSISLSFALFATNFILIAGISNTISFICRLVDNGSHLNCRNSM